MTSVKTNIKKTHKNEVYISNNELNRLLDTSCSQFKNWKQTTLAHRRILIEQLANCMSIKKEVIARQISMDMGKPITQSYGEVVKTIQLCRHYASIDIKTSTELSLPDHNSGEIIYQPLGGILLVMPWNFPLWQVLRCAIPNLLMGNVILLKHAPIVFDCAQLINDLFTEAGFSSNVFTHLKIEESQVKKVIDHRAVAGVALTGSERAGSAVASLAGKALKKCVLELGGSDPFIVCRDADLDMAAQVAVRSRMQNSGQTCIAAKRIIVHEEIYDQFLERAIQYCQEYVIGDPLSEETTMGRLAREDLIINLENQVNDSVEMGAKIQLQGGRIDDTLFFRPMIIDAISADMPLYKQEIFGPVMSVFRFKDIDEAIQLANDTTFGLGATLFSTNKETISLFKKHIEAGAIAINKLLSSTPHLPFGGIKRSGFGRELGSEGLFEFVNIKSVLH